MANEAMAAHLGYDRAEIVGSEPARFMLEADVEEGQHSSRDLQGDDERTWAAYEMRTISADGTVRINEAGSRRCSTRRGLRRLGRCDARTTERKQRERELERYETIIEAVGDPVYSSMTRVHSLRERGDRSTDNSNRTN